MGPNNEPIFNPWPQSSCRSKTKGLIGTVHEAAEAPVATAAAATGSAESGELKNVLSLLDEYDEDIIISPDPPPFPPVILTALPRRLTQL
jgi:hypothetical protein